jgi:hypothetical protein
MRHREINDWNIIVDVPITSWHISSQMDYAAVCKEPVEVPVSIFIEVVPALIPNCRKQNPCANRAASLKTTIVSTDDFR